MTVSSDAASARAALVSLFFENATLQMHDIKQRISDGARNADERERDARALGALSKVLRDLSAFDATGTSEQAHDDSGPRDIDEFRRELIRQMDDIVARRAARDGRGPDAGDD